MGEKGTTTAPAISYFDAMRYEIEPGRMACQMQAEEFGAKAADPEGIRAKVKDCDMLYFSDRWFAMLCLIELEVMSG